jgi:hypothetical protein
MPLFEKSFGAWKASAAAAAETLPAVEQPSARQIYLVDKPGAPQSQIRIGWIGVARSTPDYFPITVANTILGGSFSSRLNNNLREEHGSRGASSSFDMRAGASPFFAAAGVQTDKTGRKLKEFFNELEAIRRCRRTNWRGRRTVALRFPSAFEATGDVSRLEDMLITTRPTVTSPGRRTSRQTAADASASPRIHPARQARRRRRGSEDDRAGHPPQPRAGEGDDDRRGLRSETLTTIPALQIQTIVIVSAARGGAARSAASARRP